MDFLHKNKRWFIICLVVVCLVMAAFTGRGSYEQGGLRSSAGFVLFGGQMGLARVGNWFGERFDFFRSMNNLYYENLRLIEENERLQTDINRFLHLDEENRLLAELVNLQRRYEDYAILGADIISFDPGNWYSDFSVNRGRRDGVAVNMAVLAPGGLAGRVSSLVGYNYAIVTALTEDSSAVTAESRRTGDWGIVTGDINLSSRGLLRMSFIELAATLAVGDEIITSHISSIFPPGILIGHIVELEGSEALIKPAVDFSRLSSVLIITDIFDFDSGNGLSDNGFETNGGE
jgi:rod shape-determining protein MreC